jgi:hypothetical protein
MLNPAAETGTRWRREKAMNPKGLPCTAAAARPAVLFCGLIYAPGLETAALLDRLTAVWGNLEFVSAPVPFSYTTYYHDEMGVPLVRRYLTFQRPVPQEDLPLVKETSGTLETAFPNAAGGRTVNIDPGLLLPERLVLATTKPAGHRPYLGRGVYADLTLLYQRGSYRALPWTYPDYADPRTLEMLNRLRTRHRTQERWRSEGGPA